MTITTDKFTIYITHYLGVFQEVLLRVVRRRRRILAIAVF